MWSLSSALSWTDYFNAIATVQSRGRPQTFWYELSIQRSRHTNFTVAILQQKSIQGCDRRRHWLTVDNDFERFVRVSQMSILRPSHVL